MVPGIGGEFRDLANLPVPANGVGTANIVTVIKETYDFNLQIARPFQGMQSSSATRPPPTMATRLRNLPCRARGRAQAWAVSGSVRDACCDQETSIEPIAAQRNEELVEQGVGRNPVMKRVAADFRKVQPPLGKAEAL